MWRTIINVQRGHILAASLAVSNARVNLADSALSSADYVRIVQRLDLICNELSAVDLCLSRAAQRQPIDG